MANNRPNPFLDVPVTEAERAQAQNDSSRLLSEPRQSSPEPSASQLQAPAPLRFPSVHARPVTRHFQPSISQRIESRQYAPISPIHEEDEADSIALREPSDHRGDDGYLLAPSGPTPPLWTPIWLKQWVLGLFAAAFAGFLIGLVLLWYYDDQNDGFEVAEGVSHYAWTYTPTVIAVFVVAAWRMVDHHSKLAMPYDSLQNGPIKASESLLVDYVSNFQLLSLIEAFKNSHFAVITTITGFILLKVVTVFATGLLVLLPTQVSQSGSSIQARGFSAASFAPGGALDSSSFSALPVYAYYGTMAQGMPLENGVTFDLAFSDITVGSDTPIADDAIITGEVDAFVPIMTCKALNVQLDSPRIVNDTNSADAFASSSNISLTIRAGDVCRQISSVTVPAANPYTEILPERQVIGTMQQIYCATTNGSVLDSSGPLGLLFTITEINYQQTLFDNATDLAGGSFTIASDVSRILTNMTNIFCNASYTMTRVKVTNNTQFLDNNQAVSVELKNGAANSTLAGFSAWNATNVFAQSSISAEVLFEDTINDDTISGSSAIFTLMALTRGSQDINTLINPDVMTSAAQDTYQGIMSQYAHQVLRGTDPEDVEEGKVTREERRLRVNDVSVWTMASASGLLFLFCIALIFIAPRAVVPRDPSSIAAIATLLTRSTELNRLLRRQGAPTYQNQKSALAGFEFGTAIATTDSGNTSFKIVTSEGEPDGPNTEPSVDIKWWLPITATIPVIILTVALPLGIIVALELIQRDSDNNNGFYTVADDKWTEVYSHYIPGIVMLILATLINMLDFNIALFAPWNNLADGNAIHKKSVLNHILGNSPPLAFLQALKVRNLGAILSILAATLASVLTIIASGLYYVEHYTVDGANVTLNQLDSFDLIWQTSFSTDNGAAAMLDLLMHQHFSYPQFTYEGLVFPKLSLHNSALTTNSLTTVTGSSSHIFPAVRGNLRCDILPSDSFDLSTEKAGSDTAYATDQAFITARAALPDSCHLGGASGMDAFIIYENNFELPAGGEETYAGAQLDLLFGENATLYGNYGEARGQYISDNPPVGCPSLAFTFGRFQLGSTDKSQVTTMICYQEIQGLEANVTLKLNTTTIDPEHPPVVDDGSVFLHENPLSNNSAQSFDFRIQNNLAKEMTVFNGGSGTPASNPSSTNTFDIFFQAIINGTNKHDPTSLVGEDNQDILVDAVNQFYRTYMAQAISANMRAPLNSTSHTSQRLTRRQSSTVTTTTTLTTPRLVQDKDSKIILQVLLGLITVLSAAAWLTTRMRRVLPCNPCSIAGMMSLLAGSDLCHSVDDGLCECCGKPRRRSFGFDKGRPESIHVAPDEEDDDEREQIIPDGAEWMPESQFETVFGGKRYSMGWWRERKLIGKRRRFGVDVGARADGRDDEDWELGERRPEGPGFGDFMMRGGDRDGRGEYSRFGGANPDPAAMEAGFPREPPPGVNSGMGGRTAQRYDFGDGGGPGPATLAGRRSPFGGEA